MPSFCCPVGFGPNAWMTRPFTGQRKDGTAAVASCLTFGGSGFCAAGVTTFAVGEAATGAALAGAETTFCVAGTESFGWAICGVDWPGAASGGADAAIGCRDANCCGGCVARTP